MNFGVFFSTDIQSLLPIIFKKILYTKSPLAFSKYAMVVSCTLVGVLSLDKIGRSVPGAQEILVGFYIVTDRVKIHFIKNHIKAPHATIL